MEVETLFGAEYRVSSLATPFQQITQMCRYITFKLFIECPRWRKGTQKGKGHIISLWSNAIEYRWPSLHKLFYHTQTEFIKPFREINLENLALCIWCTILYLIIYYKADNRWALASCFCWKFVQLAKFNVISIVKHVALKYLLITETKKIITCRSYYGHIF